MLIPFLSFSDNLLHDAYNFIIFQESVDNFEIAHKTSSILVWGAGTPFQYFHWCALFSKWGGDIAETSTRVWKKHCKLK